VSEFALREGVLFDLFGRESREDPRGVAIQAMAQRWAVNQTQAERVVQTALQLFDGVQAQLGYRAEHRKLLKWAARVHEVGLAISHHHQQQHGAYVLENADLAGFSRSEQRLLAALVRNQRRKADPSGFADLSHPLAQHGPSLAVLLRLAVLFHRSQTDDPLPSISISVVGKELHLTLPSDWLAAHPLTREDLKQEKSAAAPLGYKLVVSAD
jgi:exopolyphosphatase / guanosine-5'-triphosphate,3'-diphosphate pyrophosphatase